MIAQMSRLTRSPIRRRLLEREARAMVAYESATCRDFDELLAVTDSDAQRIGEMISQPQRVTPIPICVDPAETPMTPLAAEARDLLCVGAMFYPPNVDGVLWFLREVFPRVRSDAPEAKLRIVGPRPARAIRQAVAGGDRVFVTGYADDLGPQLAASAAMVVPLRAGSGMRVKIIDAMARGMPVVSTRLGAAGIEATDGEHILLADGAAEFAAAALKLLHDPALRGRLAENARRRIEERYDWRKRYGEVDAVYARLFARGGRSA
jgi:glycosyltransferase involved in cell wall biosynthesis